MIRKPGERDFDEGAAISTMRDVKTIAVEGARGLGAGTASMLKWWLLIGLGFAAVMTVISHSGALAIVLVLGGALALFLRRFASGRRALAVAPRPARPTGGERDAASGHYDISVAGATRAAMKYAVPAVLLFPTSAATTYMLPLTLFGMVFLALAVLIFARLAGDRTILRYDAHSVTVRGLLGEGRMLWDDVDDVALRVASRFSLVTRFTSGSRRNIVLSGQRNRLAGPTRLLIPYPLLDLDQDALVDLVSTMLMLRAGAVEAIAARAPRATPAATATPTAAGMPFDPDAIMARYLAEREQVAAAARPAPPTNGRPVFGRKVA